MYYEPELKQFNESEKGKIYLNLNLINASLGYLVSLLDNFSNIKIKVCEIIKDIDIISNDIKNNTQVFDIRRKVLFNSWINDYKIDEYLPVGAKQALKALEISYSIDLLLPSLNEDYKEYMYNVSIYLKQVFKEINEAKGVSVIR